MFPNLVLLFFPVSRGSVLLQVLGLPYPAAIRYHRWLGGWVLVRTQSRASAQNLLISQLLLLLLLLQLLLLLPLLLLLLPLLSWTITALGAETLCPMLFVFTSVTSCLCCQGPTGLQCASLATHFVRTLLSLRARSSRLSMAPPTGYLGPCAMAPPAGLRAPGRLGVPRQTMQWAASRSSQAWC
jgi:hypothetical protein